MSTASLTAGFDVLEDRLREVRRSVGLAVEEPGAAAEPQPGSPSRSTEATPLDVVLLASAWIGLIALVVLAV